MKKQLDIDLEALNNIYEEFLEIVKKLEGEG